MVVMRRGFVDLLVALACIFLICEFVWLFSVLLELEGFGVGIRRNLGILGLFDLGC